LALSPLEAAAALGIRHEQVYSALRSRQLVARMNGTRRRIAVSELMRWFETWPEAKEPKE
jgi:excisionase family DNA binding protein